MRIALVGVGSLGTIIGALVVKNGCQITLIDANREHVNALNKNGATVKGMMELNVRVNAITPDEMDGIYDVVFYLVKQNNNEVALKHLLPHLGKDSVVCTMQNGVPEGAVAAVVGKGRTIGCTVSWGATWLSPGISMLTSEPSKMTYDIGELDGTVSERLKRIAEILRLSGEVRITNNLWGMRWTKLLVNATFSGMSAALGCTYGDVMDNSKARACVAHIANETLKVARGLGISLEPMQGHDLNALSFKTQKEMEATYPLIKRVWEPHRLLKASMLQDLEKGRKTEIDAINGVICDYGKKTKVQTPVNDTLVQIVKGIEQGSNKCIFSNLNMFVLPEISEQ